MTAGKSAATGTSWHISTRQSTITHTNPQQPTTTARQQRDNSATNVNRQPTTTHNNNPQQQRDNSATNVNRQPPHHTTQRSQHGHHTYSQTAASTGLESCTGASGCRAGSPLQTVRPPPAPPVASPALASQHRPGPDTNNMIAAALREVHASPMHHGQQLGPYTYRLPCTQCHPQHVMHPPHFFLVPHHTTPLSVTRNAPPRCGGS